MSRTKYAQKTSKSPLESIYWKPQEPGRSPGPYPPPLTRKSNKLCPACISGEDQRVFTAAHAASKSLFPPSRRVTVETSPLYGTPVSEIRRLAL